MPLDPESLYVQLGRLIQTMPTIPTGNLTPLPTEVSIWCGKAYALVSETRDLADAMAIKQACDNLNFGNRSALIQTITTILYRALAVAELRAPVSVQGSFIPAGNAFDAMTAVGKVLQSAANDILIVDPYMDEKALSDFAALAREGVPIRLLADAKHVKDTLKPAATRWAEQYRQVRPLEARLAPARTLHDRLIIVDGATAWVLTQSLNAFAARAPASIVRSDDETAGLKVSAYGAIWQSASQI